MENHRRKWNRFVSRIRSSRGTHNFIPRSVIGSGNISNSSVAVDVSFSGRYTRFTRDNDRIRPPLQIASRSYWSFTNPVVRLPQGGKFVSFTPKCLSGLNFQTILSGQASYDDFSRNCWLENHLHRFGGLIVQEVTTENGSNVTGSNVTGSDVTGSNVTGSNVTGSETRAQVASDNENSFTSSDNENRFTSSDIENRFTSSDTPQTEISVSAAITLWNNRSTNRDINTVSSSSSSFISSAASEMTHSYIAGFAFDPDAPFPDVPPPYSEQNDDPPPPYTEIFNSTAGSSQNRRRGNTSSYGLNFHDILW